MNWTGIPIPDTSAGIVTITLGVDSDQVSVAIPVIGASGYARLKVTE